MSILEISKTQIAFHYIGNFISQFQKICCFYCWSPKTSSKFCTWSLVHQFLFFFFFFADFVAFHASKRLTDTGSKRIELPMEKEQSGDLAAICGLRSEKGACYMIL